MPPLVKINIDQETIPKSRQTILINLFKDFAEELRLHLYEYKIGLFKPKWFVMRRLGRLLWVRHLMQWLQRTKTQDLEQFLIKNRTNISVFPELDCSIIAKDLAKDGISKGLILPQKFVQEMVEFAENNPCYANRNSQLSFYYNNRPKAEAQFNTSVVTGDYFNAEANCSLIQKLAQDSQLIEIAALYFGTKPTYFGSRLWWSFATEATSYQRRKAAQLFHYDLDDYCFLKYFFYLTKVTLESGPHVYISGTHRQKKLRHQLLRKRYSDEEILQSYHSQNMLILCEESGFGFVEDTFGFHKGLPPVTEDRLILQIEYGINHYGMH